MLILKVYALLALAVSIMKNNMKTIVVLTYRDYDTQDIEGVFSCDYEITEDDWYEFAEMQEKIREEVYEQYKRKACERVGFDYDSTIHLSSAAPEQQEYVQWLGSQPSIFEMYKAVHNLEPVNFFEVVE